QDDRAGVLAQITLEAAAREQPRVLAAGCDQHERAGFAVGRARGVHQHAQRQRMVSGAFALEKRQQRAQGCFHASDYVLRPGRTDALITLMGNKTALALQVAGREKRRGRGRARGESAGKVRERLLEAARELFLRYGYRAVSSRQIGAAAGVNFAMIRYYFGGKPGLYREILQGVLVPGGPMRAMFLREFPERLAPIVERAVRAQIERGALRADLDPKLLVLSVVSLAVFPFLGFPLTSRVFGVRNDEEFVTRFLRHTQALLACGVAPGGRPA